MPNRPFSQHTTEMLEQASRESWNDAVTLKPLLEELRFRTRPKARILADRLSARLQELQDPGGSRARGASGPEAATRIAELEAMLNAQSAELREWKARCARAEANAGRSADPLAALYAQVWLTPDCPDVVLDAVRRTLRKENHPDRATPPEKAKAEERFKKFENLFDTIMERRK